MKRLLTLILLVALVLCGVVVAGRLASYPAPGYQNGYEPQQPIAFSHRQHAGDLQISCEYCHYGAENSRHAGIPASSVCMNCHRFVTASQKAMVAEILAARKENRAPEPVVSPELQKLYDSMGLNFKLERDPPEALPALGAGAVGLLASPMSPGPLLAASALFPGRIGKTPQPIRWVKVDNLPDYACFEHRAHVTAGVKCQECHGPVETMDRVRQQSDLSMGWCVNCHRKCQQEGVNGKAVKPSLDCATCHH